ncbi:MAG: hypothetical protein F6K16_37055, partial [Symploca sp. SIO2B6]|nr:hypothetical protein [Symploca sp. SIO2B6]
MRQEFVNFKFTASTLSGKNIEALSAIIECNSDSNQCRLECQSDNQGNFIVRASREEFPEFFNEQSSLGLTIQNSNNLVVYKNSEQFCHPINFDLGVLVEDIEIKEKNRYDYSLINCELCQAIYEASQKIFPPSRQYLAGNFISENISKLDVLSKISLELINGNHKAIPILNDLFGLERESDFFIGDIDADQIINDLIINLEESAYNTESINLYSKEILNHYLITCIAIAGTISAGEDIELALLNYASLIKLISDIEALERAGVEARKVLQGDQLAEFNLMSLVAEGLAPIASPDLGFRNKDVVGFSPDVNYEESELLPTPKEWRLPESWKSRLKEYKFELQEVIPKGYIPGPDDAPKPPEFDINIFDPFRRIIQNKYWDKFRKGIRYTCTLELMKIAPLGVSFYNMEKISDRTLCRGETVEITGSDFGDTGKVVMSSRTGSVQREIYITPQHWTSNKVIFTVPEDAISGPISLSIIYKVIDICGQTRNLFKGGNSFLIFIPELAGDLNVKRDGELNYSKATEIYKIIQRGEIIRNDFARILWYTKDSESAEVVQVNPDQSQIVLKKLTQNELNKSDSLLWPLNNFEPDDNKYIFSLTATSIKQCKVRSWRAEIDVFHGVKAFIDKFSVNGENFRIIISSFETIEVSWSILDASKAYLNILSLESSNSRTIDINDFDSSLQLSPSKNTKVSLSCVGKI